MLVNDYSKQVCVSLVYLNYYSVSIPKAVQWDDIFSICSVSNAATDLESWLPGASSHGFSAELAWLDICEFLTFIRFFGDIPNNTHPLA